MSTSFGCGVFVGKTAEADPMELLNNVMNIIGNIKPKKNAGNEGDWKNFRSFFFSGSGSVKLDIKASSQFGINNLLQGSL
jgi:hypothetical protein